MKKRFNSTSSGKFPVKSSADENSGKFYRPLSHYIRGSVVDINGDALKCDAQVVYETEDDISTMENGNGITPLAPCNPRVDYFDIFEHSNSASAEKATAKSIAPILSDSDNTDIVSGE